MTILRVKRMGFSGPSSDILGFESLSFASCSSHRRVEGIRFSSSARPRTHSFDRFRKGSVSFSRRSRSGLILLFETDTKNGSKHRFRSRFSRNRLYFFWGGWSLTVDWNHPSSRVFRSRCLFFFYWVAGNVRLEAMGAMEEDRSASLPWVEKLYVSSSEERSVRSTRAIVSDAKLFLRSPRLVVVPSASETFPIKTRSCTFWKTCSRPTHYLICFFTDLQELVKRQRPSPWHISCLVKSCTSQGC